jgi:hypothetical protein
MSEGDAAMTSRENLDEEVRYFVPGIGEAAVLRTMARRCFADSFAHLFDREPFEQFLNEVYGKGGSMSRELLDTNIEWLIAEVGGEIIGYAKLRPLAPPHPIRARSSGATADLCVAGVARTWGGRAVDALGLGPRPYARCTRDISYCF